MAFRWQVFRSNSNVCRRSCSTWTSAEDAYQVLGLSRGSSDAEIKKAFQNLAKATHPDLQRDSKPCPTTTDSFLRILAAYQILSDPVKRARYDTELSSREQQKGSASSHSKNQTSSGGGYRQRQRQRQGEQWSTPHFVRSQEYEEDIEDVVEWLRHYRSTVSRIINEKEQLGNTGWQGTMSTDLHKIFKRMYFGPDPSLIVGFPECFEAEERSNPWVSDILQLVCGRFLFGAVRPAHSRSQIPGEFTKDSKDRNLWEQVDTAAYVRVELIMNGKVAAWAMRKPLHTMEAPSGPAIIDMISVYLGDHSDGKLLGTIQGLSATEAGLKGVVNDSNGLSTHTILHHWTPLVRHLHWYRFAYETMHCDCRCRRAWLLPSRYWLFKPRSDSHNIGGWYIESFKPRSLLSHHEFKLHPAMFILATAYKTLDKESRQRTSIPNAMRVKLWRLYDAAAAKWSSLLKRWRWHQ